MEKKTKKKWQVQVGRKVWLFYGTEKPKVTELKDNKIRGTNYTIVFTDELIEKPLPPSIKDK